MSNNGYGKVKYTTITCTDEEFKWCYSYNELQTILNDICQNHTIKKLYVGLQAFLESSNYKKSYYDFSYFGGSVIMLFDSIGIEFLVHGTGMIEYRKLNLSDIVTKETKDFPPADMGESSDNYYYDLSSAFDLNYENEKVKRVKVDRIAYYSFSLSDFDEQKAEEAMKENNLPNNIHFMLENGLDLCIYANDIEGVDIGIK